ncbi:MAG TPA: PDZ domain-containing protein, partial [Candidatus Kapabacteria bacterium]|nr:PDZ domain-containing protein [Candidatus Kapabacteria bacterium]
MNFYVTISTVFSGTGFAPLPSRLYVQQEIECLKHIKSKDEHIFIKDTLKTGSFILSIGDMNCKKINSIDSCIKNYKSSDTILIKALNYKVFRHIKKEEQNIKFESLVSVYKIEKKKLNTLSILELNNGIFIHFVVENGATDRAGIKSGDVLFSVGGKQLAFEQLPEKYGLTRESLKHLRS